MTATDTSINAYQKLKEEGKLGKQKQLVFDTLRMSQEDMTINELAELTGLPKGTVSGRLNDLKDDHGLVQDLSGDAKRKDKHTGIKSKVWTLTAGDSSSSVSNAKVEDAASTTETSGEEPPNFTSDLKNIEMKEPEALFVDDEQSDKGVTSDDKKMSGDMTKDKPEPGEVIFG